MENELEQALSNLLAYCNHDNRDPRKFRAIREAQIALQNTRRA